MALCKLSQVVGTLKRKATVLCVFWACKPSKSSLGEGPESFKDSHFAPMSGYHLVYSPAPV